MRQAFAHPPLRAAAALALLSGLCLAPSLSLAQARDHSWDPGVPNMNGDAVTPYSKPAPPVATPQLRPVEKQASAAFKTRGDHVFTVPDYTSITFVVDGGGGSAARPVTPVAENPTRYDPDFGTPGYDGSDSAVRNLGLVGSGGGFGNGVTAIYRGGCFPKCTPPWPYSTIGNDSVTMTFYRGADGNAAGGDVNTVGGAGNGGKPTEAGGRNGGGNGGRAVKNYLRGQAGAPAPGQALSLHVGAGGDPAVVTEPMRLKGTKTLPGGEGAVLVNWTYIVYE